MALKSKSSQGDICSLGICANINLFVRLPPRLLKDRVCFVPVQSLMHSKRFLHHQIQAVLSRSFANHALLSTFKYPHHLQAMAVKTTSVDHPFHQGCAAVVPAA